MKCDGEFDDDDDDEFNHNESKSIVVQEKRNRALRRKMTRMKHGLNFKMTANSFLWF